METFSLSRYFSATVFCGPTASGQSHLNPARNPDPAANFTAFQEIPRILMLTCRLPFCENLAPVTKVAEDGPWRNNMRGPG